MRVLARVAPDRVERRPAPSPARPGRNGVVIRQAAISGGRSRLDRARRRHRLRDARVVRLCDPPGRLDRVAAAHAGRPAARRGQAALAHCRDGNLFARIVSERMRAAERIELARALAVAEVDVLADDRADLCGRRRRGRTAPPPSCKPRPARRRSGATNPTRSRRCWTTTRGPRRLRSARGARPRRRVVGSRHARRPRRP